MTILHALHLFGLRVFGIRHHRAGLARIDRDFLSGVGADHRGGVQVVKAFAGFGAEAFGAPLFLRHMRVLFDQVVLLQRIAATCHKQRMVSKGLAQTMRDTDMGEHVLSGNPPIKVVLRQSARAKRLSLRMSRLDGSVSLTMPRGTRKRAALSFLAEREAWLRGHLANVAPATVVSVGVSVPYAGEDLPVLLRPDCPSALTAEGFSVRDPATAGGRVRAILKAKAREQLLAVSDDYAAAIGKSFDRISLRDTRSRWGSCSSRGTLMYSWRLIMAPPEVLHYVAAHEVAHLQEMNHSPAFWSVVAALFGDYTPPRRWLRENGDRLHRYKFGD